MISAVTPGAPDAVPAADPDADYFATEAHYLSLARRIAAVLRAGGTFVLVTGDPPMRAHPFAQALRTVTESRHAVICTYCRPDLTLDAISRAGSVVAALPKRDAAPGEGATVASETPEPTPPLFLFDDVDQLSEQQIREIFGVARLSARKGAAVVLLARPGFLARLEELPLQFLKDKLAAQLGFHEVGQDESIEFLRHQLAVRHRRDESRGIPLGVVCSLAASALLLAVGFGSFLFVHYVNLADAPPTRSAGGTAPTQEISTPQSVPIAPIAAKTVSLAERASTVSSVPPIAATPPVPMPQPALPGTTRVGAKASANLRDTSRTVAADVPPPAPETTPSGASPAPEQEQTTPQAASRAASLPPAQSPAGQRLTPAETAAFVSRGDGFLSAGDIASARLFYERAAEAGDGSAALRLGATFDPGFLRRAGVRGTNGDPARASSWYNRARDLGNPAAERPRTLQQQDLAEPNTPAQ